MAAKCGRVNLEFRVLFVMDITIDFSFFYRLLEMPPHQAAWFLFVHGGWAIFLIIFLGISWSNYIVGIQEKYRRKLKYTLLSIDVPKENQQGPKAVEHIFANLAAAQSSGNLIDKYIEGYTQPPFSFEIASLGGYIQFLIRMPEKFRDLAEAAVYAQYPDAEISETDDYTREAPSNFPNKEFDLWGTELKLYNKDAYPIRTYPAFEDMTSKDDKFKDPMASLLETLGKVGEEEQVWLQLILTPCKSEWKSKGAVEVKKLIGQKVEVKKSLSDKIIESPLRLFEKLGDLFFAVPSAKKKEEKKEYNLMSYLTPGEKEVVTAMQNKLSKIGFQIQFRFIYLAKKEFFNKGKAISGVMGAIQQFNTLNMNGFKPDSETKTGVDYWFVKMRVTARQRSIMAAYKERKNTGKFFILNTEELATLFHFPVAAVKSPFLKKVEVKKGEAPGILPVSETPFEEAEEKEKAGEPPTNLPIAEE